jgi:hypothetical protein
MRNSELGALHARFPGGCVGVTLKESDILVTSPGLPHAVYTPLGRYTSEAPESKPKTLTTSVVMGGFFWTADTFAQTIKVLRMQLAMELWENEYVLELDLESMAVVVEVLDDADLFPRRLQPEIFLEINQLLHVM